MKPTPEQIEEWFESPTTEYFFGLLSKLKTDAYEQLANQGYDTQSAEQLQANRGHLWGIHNTLEDIEQAFTSKSLSDLEEDDGEHVGDSPEGRQDSHPAG